VDSLQPFDYYKKLFLVLPKDFCEILLPHHGVCQKMVDQLVDDLENFIFSVQPTP